MDLLEVKFKKRLRLDSSKLLVVGSNPARGAGKTLEKPRFQEKAWAFRF
jgi:hypothetical protein